MISPPDRQPANPDALVDQLRSAWLADLKKADLADDSIRKYREALRDFVRWCNEENIKIGLVKRGEVCEFRDSQLARYSRSAVNIKLAALRRFYDFLLDNSPLEINPAARVRCAARHGEAHRRRDELSDAEMRALLDGCATPRRDESRLVCERDRAILYLMAYCALRMIEIHRADREDLEERGGRVVLWVQGKGRKQPDQYVVLPAPALDAIKLWLNVHPAGGQGPLFVSLSAQTRGRRLTTNFIRRMIRRRMDRAGILRSSTTPDSIRQSAITRALQNGASPAAVQAMARHSRIDSHWPEHRRLKNPAEDVIRYDDIDSGGPVKKMSPK